MKKRCYVFRLIGSSEQRLVLADTLSEAIEQFRLVTRDDLAERIDKGMFNVSYLGSRLGDTDVFDVVEVGQ